MKKIFLLTTIALSAALYSCTEDDIINDGIASTSNEIHMNPVLKNATSRSTEAHDLATDNLVDFNVTAYHGEDMYFEDVDYKYSNGNWVSANKYYWPLEGDLTFYGYAPKESDNGVTRTGYNTYTVVQQTTAEDQPDFIVSKTTSNRESGSTGVTLNFRHAMSRIAVQLKNTNTGLKMNVTDWKVGNIYNKGDFTLSEENTDTHNGSLSDADWNYTEEGYTQSVETEAVNSTISPYTVTHTTSAVSVPDFKDFIVIPQQLIDATKYTGESVGDEFAGSYIAVEMEILNAADDAVIVEKQWCYWPIATKWEPGKKYTYVIDLAGGGYHGQNVSDDGSDTDGGGESLDPVLKDLDVKFVNCIVDDWNGVPEETVMNKDYTDYLCFKANYSSKFKMTKKGTTWKHEPNIEYSFDKETWTPLVLETDITVNAGETIYLRGNNPEGFNESASNYIRCIMSGSFNGGGNIMTLVDPTGNSKTIPNAYCFRSLFSSCNDLKTAPKLPATNLKPHCYEMLFYYNQYLTEAPVLPATTLANACYQQMFEHCINLIEAPVLKAHVLADSCYFQMFKHCEKFVDAPELPSTSLAPYCYYGMFDFCTKITTAPALPATTLARACYSQMFEFCTNLTNAPGLPALIMEPSCYSSMLRNTAISIAPELPSTQLASGCYANMFLGCINLTKAPDLPATELVGSCYGSMFNGCTKLKYVKALFLSCDKEENGLIYWMSEVPLTGTFVRNPNATWTYEEAVIPRNWTIVDATD